MARDRAPFARASKRAGARSAEAARARARANRDGAAKWRIASHLTITRVGPHMERRALPRGGARRRRAGNALRKPFAFGRVPGDGKGAGMTSRTRARGFSLHGWRCFGASRRFDWPAVDLGLARDFLSEWDVKPRLQSSSRFFGTGDPMKPPTETRRRPINFAHFFRIHACTSTSRTQEIRISLKIKRRVSAPSVSRRSIIRSRRRLRQPLVGSEPLLVGHGRIRAFAYEILRYVLVPVRQREVHGGVPLRVARV